MNGNEINFFAWLDDFTHLFALLGTNPLALCAAGCAAVLAGVLIFIKLTRGD